MFLRAGLRAKGGMAGRLGTLILASAAVLLVLPTAAYADAAATAAGAAAHGPSAGDVLVAILRGIEYALLLLACGLALLSMLGRDLPLRLPAVPVAAALLASGVAVVVAEALLASSASAAGAIDYLTNGFTGLARVARIALEAALLEVALVRARLSPVLLAGVVVAAAAAGQGADVGSTWPGIAVNAVYLAAAGVWAGGIMALALLRVTGRWQAGGSELLPRFIRVAPWAFLVSVSLAVVQAVQFLTGPGEVLTTSHVLTLVAKVAAVAVIAALSLLAWRRIRVGTGSGAVAVLVAVAAAAAVAVYPVVPKPARQEPAASGHAVTRASPFPQSGDLTMGGRAGQTMVGLTVHPGRPGVNTVRVYLATPATAASRARLQVQGAWHAFSSCGGPCRTVTVDLEGGQRLAVAVAGRGGGTAVFHLPPLPAKDGTTLTRSATAQMNGLDTYRVAEVLSGFRSAYTYARPHQLWIRTWYGDGVQQSLWLGSSLYEKTSPGAPWRLKSKGTLAPVPYFNWDPFRPLVDVHIVGTGTVSGMPVTVVTAFGGHGRDPDSVWFTLSVDRNTGRVLRSQMWAPNHFMDDRYHAFNQPPGLPSLRGG